MPCHWHDDLEVADGCLHPPAKVEVEVAGAGLVLRCRLCGQAVKEMEAWSAQPAAGGRA